MRTRDARYPETQLGDADPLYSRHGAVRLAPERPDLPRMVALPVCRGMAPDYARRNHLFTLWVGVAA